MNIFIIITNFCRFSRLAEIATFQPSFANFMAKALPIPVLPPVIQIVFYSLYKDV